MVHSWPASRMVAASRSPVRPQFGEYTRKRPRWPPVKKLATLRANCCVEGAYWKPISLMIHSSCATTILPVACAADAAQSIATMTTDAFRTVNIATASLADCLGRAVQEHDLFHTRRRR